MSEMTIKIPLSNGMFATVDEADAWLLDEKWHGSFRKGYAHVYAKRYLPRSAPKGTPYSMHRLVLGVTDPTIFVDHINGDTLDNRRENLRSVTVTENRRNISGATKASKSGILGVSWARRQQSWYAQIQVGRKNHHLGYFKDLEQAKAARLLAEAKFWGVQPRRAGEHEAQQCGS